MWGCIKVMDEGGKKDDYKYKLKAKVRHPGELSSTNVHTVLNGGLSRC